jgi:hypothetical protein
VLRPAARRGLSVNPIGDARHFVTQRHSGASPDGDVLHSFVRPGPSASPDGDALSACTDLLAPQARICCSVLSCQWFPGLS